MHWSDSLLLWRDMHIDGNLLRSCCAPDFDWDRFARSVNTHDGLQLGFAPLQCGLIGRQRDIVLSFDRRSFKMCVCNIGSSVVEERERFDAKGGLLCHWELDEATGRIWLHHYARNILALHG